MDKLIKIRAAMFAAIGKQTRLSRNGYSIVFASPQCGRSDLSSDELLAERQAHAAGLNLANVTDEQVFAYQKWYERMYHDRRINQARIQITRPYSEVRGHQLVRVNGVRLMDGWGEMVDWRVVDMDEYHDPEATNRIGSQGAYRTRPNYAGIDRCVSELINNHREYAGARVQDNNRRE